MKIRMETVGEKIKRKFKKNNQETPMKFYKKKNVRLEVYDKRKKYVTYYREKKKEKKKKKKIWLQPGSNSGHPHGSPT